MSKHTPGPWSPEFRSGRAASMYGHVVCAFVYTTKLGIDDGRDAIVEVRGAKDDAERRANAYLIAAAPEMLEALIAADAALFEYSQMLRLREGDRNPGEVAAPLVQSAIAKAKGES